MTSASDILILQVSKTLVVCVCSISFIKFVVSFSMEWLYNIIEEWEMVCFTVFPQWNCHFLIPVCRAKLCRFYFSMFSTKFAKFVEKVACKGFRTHQHTSTSRALEVLSCSLCVSATALDLDFQPIPLSEWKRKWTYTSIAWRKCQSTPGSVAWHIYVSKRKWTHSSVAWKCKRRTVASHDVCVKEQGIIYPSVIFHGKLLNYHAQSISLFTMKSHEILAHDHEMFGFVVCV